MHPQCAGPGSLYTSQTFSVSIPSSLRDRFLVYGPRATSTASGSRFAAGNTSGLLDYIATWQVPHSYFTQFYVASVLSSVFWGLQLFFRGGVFQAIASRVSEEHRQESMSLNQIMICWLLLAMQGSRRLWESVIFAKPSTSKMWFVHWALGLGFYLAAGVAIWIEGSGKDTWYMCDISLLTSRPAGTILTQPLTVDHIKITNAPSVRTFLCVPLFLMASGMQHDCHHFLFSLKKYTLPDHPIFRGIVCPHYGAECVIYMSLAVLAAPPGQWVNKTMLSCLAFVAVNLGLTARTTKQWYMQKFDKEEVQRRWLMIPYLY